MSCFVVCILFACHETRLNPNANLTLEDFQSFADDQLRFDVPLMRQKLATLVNEERDSMFRDRHLRTLYVEDEQMLWVRRSGVTAMADSLLIYINKVGEIGFSKEKFRVSQIEADLERMRNLDFAGANDINTVATRLDYNLTRAYLRYVTGQGYGFINPGKVFNKLDYNPDDSTHRQFRQLYAVKTRLPEQSDYQRFFDAVRNESMPEILREVQPKGALYERLKSMLATSAGAERSRIMANMERCRWRQDISTTGAEKYVLVNVPSYHLIYVDGKEVNEMKIVCGSRKTKTPLLSSSITRMDINPQWIIPWSIVKNDVAPHAGDAEYFSSRNYFIREKSTGKRVDPELLAYEDMLTGGYSVIQEGGEGNALGRIIFRFPNDFAIYLHDTSTKSTFGRVDRSASHGCIRVEQPFELAKFLLKEKDETLFEKIRYSMSIHTRVPADADVNNPIYHVDKSKLLHNVKVEPNIPVLITYMTITLMPGGELRTYSDVYGYDAVMNSILRRLE